MKQILFVDVSPADSSASRKVARKLEERLRREHPDARIVHRDLASTPVPHLDAQTVRGMRGGGPGAELSDELTAELLASDMLVLATPMWNFGLPSALKAWVDHVVRAGKTFTYSANGPEGLASGKTAVVIVASGGVYSSGPMQAYDFVVPYLTTVLGFIGMRDVEVIRAEGMAMSEVSGKAIEAAEMAAEALAV